MVIAVGDDFPLTRKLKMSPIDLVEGHRNSSPYVTYFVFFSGPNVNEKKSRVSFLYSVQNIGKLLLRNKLELIVFL